MSRVYTNSVQYFNQEYWNTKYSSLDRTMAFHRLQSDINVLSSEINRLCKISYTSWTNTDKIRSLDAQIEYLEHMLSKIKEEQKKQ